MAEKKNIKKTLKKNEDAKQLEKDYYEIMQGCNFIPTVNNDPLFYTSLQFEKLSFYPPSSTSTVTSDLSI